MPNKKRVNTKEEELKSIHSVFKALKVCNVVTLRNTLEQHYSHIWEQTNNQKHSDEKRIKRALDKLIDFGLAKKEKIGKEYQFTYLWDTKELEESYKISEALNV